MLVPMRNSFPEAVHCLSTHNTFFKKVPVNYRPWEKKEFLNNSVLHCTVLKHLLLFMDDCLSIIFLDIQSVNCFDLIWHLPHTGVR